jgi:signal transduction histidine kinase/ActR/RegA family two-component response regulator
MAKRESGGDRDERILVLAPTGRDAALTARFVGDAGLAAEVCASVEELCERMLAGAGLAFITGEALTPEAMRCLLAALAQQPAWSDFPLVVLTSGGGETPANAELLAELGEAGNVTLIERPVRVTTLVSTLKSALRARRRQYDVRDHIAAAEAANRLKDEFLATVSHELRTPLTAVLGWVHLLRAGNLDEKHSARAVETIERNARSQVQLIDDLLDVSRIITGKLRLDVRPLDPATPVESAVEAVMPAAASKEIRIQKVLDTNLRSISGDAARLQQVVWNLLSNAIKFTPRGGRVAVRLARAESHVEISVADDGDGIAPEFLPYVFDRFRQADGTTTRRVGGLGLGLAIVRHLVELHGGTVSAESEGEGKGSTFTVKLPLMLVYKSEPDAERARTPARTKGEAARSLAECPENLDGLKVLVVDDEPDTLEIIRVSLDQCGARVTTANSSAEALNLLRSTPPDVIISDIGMPTEDGFDFIRKVRELPPERGGRTPAVALTAYARAEDRLRVLRSGYQMHVAKPVELTELVAIVANVAGRV